MSAPDIKFPILFCASLNFRLGAAFIAAVAAKRFTYIQVSRPRYCIRTLSGINTYQDTTLEHPYAQTHIPEHQTHTAHTTHSSTYVFTDTRLENCHCRTYQSNKGNPVRTHASVHHK
jgi:hypothetical protein